MFIEKDNPDDPYKRQNATPSTPGQTSVGAGGGAGGQLGTGTTSTPSTQTPTATNPTQSFATVQDYLGANKAQGDQLGTQFNGKLNTSLGAEKGTIDQSAGQVKNDINAGTTNYDANLVSTAVKDPTKVANNNDQLQGFLKQWNAAYTGPQSFEGSNQYGAATNAATEATQKAAEVGDAGGRKQILEDDFGVTGQGNKGLDQALLQNSSEFGNTQNLGKQFGNVNDYLKNTAGDVNATATKAAADTKAAHDNTRGAFANSFNGLQTDLNNRVNQTQTQAQTQTDQIKADLKSGDAEKIATDLKNFNISPEQKASIQDYLSSLNKDYGRNIDLSDALTFNPKTDISASNVASKEDYDKAAALQKLTGQDYTGLLNPNDASKAGTWNNLAGSLQGKDIDAGLRQALVQSELEKLNAPAAPAGGTSSQAPKEKSLKDYLTGAPGAVANAPLSLAGHSLDLAGHAVGKVATNVGNAVSKAFGGSSKKDAVVNLSPFKSADLTPPSKANAATTKSIVDIISKPIATNGSYHEGGVYDAVNRIGQLKSFLDQGQLTPEEYHQYAQPLIDWAQSSSGTILSASSAAANSVKPAYQNLQQYLNPNVVRAQ